MKIINFVIILFVLGIGIFSCEEEKFTDPTPKGRMEEVSFAKDTFVFAEGAGKVQIPLIAAKYVNYATKIKVKITPVATADSTLAVEKTHFFIDLKEVTILLGQSLINLDVRLVDDTIINPNRVFALDIETITGGGLPAKIKQRCIVILRNDDFIPEATIVFENPTASVKENGRKLMVPFYLTKEVAGDIVITFAAQTTEEPGTTLAKEGFHFNVVNKVVPLPVGTKRGEVQLEIIDDDVAAGNTAFGLVIRKVTGALASRDSVCRVEILDDDLNRVIRFESDTLTVDEDGGTIELPLIFENGADPERMISGRVVIDEWMGCADGDFTIENPEFSTSGDETLKVRVKMKDNNAFGEWGVVLAFRDLKGANALYKTTVLNVKDDERMLAFGAPDFIINEDTTAVNIPIKLLGGPARENVEVMIEVDAANTTAVQEQYSFRNTVTFFKGMDEANIAFTPKVHASKEDKVVALKLKTTTPKVSVAEGVSSANVTIRNTDASFGFGRTTAPVLRGRQIIIPVISSGFAEGIIADIAIKSGSTAVEGTHFTISEYKRLVFKPNELRKELIVDAKNFKDAGAFGFTLEFTNVEVGGGSGADILNPETKTCVVDLVVPEVIYFSTEEEKNDGPAVAANIVDDNPATFWHTKWSSGEGINPPNPHTLVVDMHSTVNMDEIQLLRRKGNGDTKKVVVETSKDNTNWSSFATVSTFTGDKGVAKPERPSVGRYVRLTVTGKDNGVASLGELYVLGKNQ